MNAAQQRRLTPVLAGVVVLLGTLLLVLLGGVGRGTRWAAPRTLPALPSADRADLPRATPLQQFSVVWDRPLFNPDRKPVAHASAGGSNLGDLELTGIIITPGLRMALLHDKNGNREIRLRQGDSLPDGSVTLVEVQQRSAVFDSAAGRTELKLPAGAPIDQTRGDAGEDRDRPPPAGASMMHPQPDAAARPHFESGPAPARPSLTPASSAGPTGATLERLRRTIEKRRAERAAASHEGEH
jgi:general secretion pathway protein N